MKKILVLFCFAMSYLMAFPQEEASPLSVKDFMVKNGESVDLELIPEDARTDWDSNPVCLVIVKLTGVDANVVNKLIFVPNGIDIMHKTIKNGQVWLYVSSNKAGEIKTVYLGDCIFKLPYKLEAHKVYELTLGMATANIIVKTTPAEAEIIVDGETVGTGFANVAVAIGSEHRLQVQCQDYYQFEDMYKFDKEEKKELEVKLVPNFGYLTVKSQPEGAQVFVDGNVVGTTPYLLGKVKRGQRRVEVRKKGYVSHADIISIKNGQTNTHMDNIKLKPLNTTYGTLVVVSEPSFVQVSIDDRQYGLTPTTISDLEAGTYTIQLTKKGYENLTQTVEIESGTDTLRTVMTRINDDEYDFITINVRGITFDMAEVDGGTFIMGCTSEKGDCQEDALPAHKVTLDKYYIGMNEVTQELWRIVMDGKYFSTIIGLKWDEATSFINKLNEITGLHFRMPTEAEWEFAARGGVKSKGYEYSGGKYAIVGYNNFRQNELGIIGMSDEKSEWCQDYFGPYSPESQKNPTGPETGKKRVSRGAGPDKHGKKVWERFSKDESGTWAGSCALRLVLEP